MWHLRTTLIIGELELYHMDQELMDTKNKWWLVLVR